MIKASDELSVALEKGKICEQSNHCCRYGAGFVIDEDVPKLANHLAVSEEQVEHMCLEKVTVFGKQIRRLKMVRDGKPYGTCVFFHPRLGCSVHEAKPLHCRVGNCSKFGEQLTQWFAVNHLINRTSPAAVAEWKTYLANHEPIQGAHPDEWEE